VTIQAHRAIPFLQPKAPERFAPCPWHRVWVVVGRRDGSATTFSLAGAFTPSEVRAEPDGFGIVGSGTPFRPPIDVTTRPWFQALLQEQRNFSFGFNRIRSKEIVAELERHFDIPERKQDRRNPVRAGELFQRLCPNPSVRSACEDRLAQSICFAHRCAPASWEVTMFDDRLRLNVGQVEVLTLSASELRFIFSASTEITTNRLLSVEFDPKNPVYPAVPRPSGVCRLNSADIQTVPNPFWDAHEEFISDAAHLKRVSPFKKSFSPAVVDYLEKSLGKSLPGRRIGLRASPNGQ
jgi:hypothetical protein